MPLLNKHAADDFPVRLITIPQYCRAYHTGRTRTYELIRSGRLQTINNGNRRLITVDSAERLLAEAAANPVPLPAKV